MGRCRKEPEITCNYNYHFMMPMGAPMGNMDHMSHMDGFSHDIYAGMYPELYMPGMGVPPCPMPGSMHDYYGANPHGNPVGVTAGAFVGGPFFGRPRFPFLFPFLFPFPFLFFPFF